VSIRLTVSGVTKSFGGVHALHDVSFKVDAGSVVGIIGPNGAGKSTLFNALTNVDPPDHGSVTVGTTDLHGLPAHRVAGFGIARTFQTSRTFPHLSVEENILVGTYCSPTRPSTFSEFLGFARARRFTRSSRSRCHELMSVLGLNQWRDSSPRTLPPAAQKYVDFARAMMSSPRLLLLDEPAAGLNDRETDEMGAAIKAANLLGVTVIVVEHNMALLMGIADNVVVLDAGKVIMSGAPDEVRRDPRVVSAYFGSSEEEHA
jgi:branched-chain amino acid transport system ATP-binding protein